MMGLVRSADHQRVLAECAASRAEAADLRVALTIERERYDALLQTVLAMKTTGAQVVPVAAGLVEPAAPVVRETDELKLLIGEVCGADYQKRAMMLRALASDRALKVPEADIRAAIIHGYEGTGVPG